LFGPWWAAEQQERGRAAAVADYKRAQSAHSKCVYCMESPARPKHLHVSYGNLAYLAGGVIRTITPPTLN